MPVSSPSTPFPATPTAPRTAPGATEGAACADEASATMSIPVATGPVAPLTVRVEPPEGPPIVVTLAPGTSLVLGAGEGADVRVPDPTVSRRHVRLTHAGAGAEATDLGSTNGLRAGSAHVRHALVLPGGSVEVGRTVVAVSAPAADEPTAQRRLRALVGDSTPMRALAGSVRRVAGLRLPVLLRGETGTGKDLVARALHDESGRARGPFVVLNAAAIARELAESELFGHRRGAFTGAIRDRKGAFREADGGTLFLDEIAALPLDLQAKLLRAVEEGMVRPVGAEAPVPVDVRLVAATCEPLEAMVAERRFRGDLYERLAVCVVAVPPLRARLEDVGPLATHLLRSSELGGRELARGAVAALRGHRWPGNVRELRNVVVQAALRAGDRIEARDVEAVLAERAQLPRRRMTPADALRVFEAEGGNVSAAARRADLPRSTMRDLLRTAAAERASGP